MFRQVFDPNNLFWRLISRGVDFVGLGLLWVLLCLPVVTIGPATAALYYTVVKVFRQKETDGFRLYLIQFRANLKRGVIATLICIPVAAVVVWFYAAMSAARDESSLGAVMFVAYWVVLLIPAGVVCWLIPILARFESGVKDSFRTAFILALRHLPSTFVVVLLNLEAVTFTLENLWPVFFTPVLCSLLSSLFQERVFLKYLNEEDKAALEGRDLEEEEEE